MPPVSLPPLRLAASLLTLTAALAGCGGGDGSDAPATSAPRAESSTAQHTPMQVLVPAYFNPSPGWDDITRGAKAYPDVKITAILNPENGNFTQANSQFTDAINAFRAQGGRVVGYVATGYGSRSMGAVKANVDNYLRLYPGVSGFFLDEMAAKSDQLAFYREIYEYIKGKSADLQIIGNPGTFPDGAYAGITDALVTFEGLETDYRQINPQPQSTWVYDRPTTAQAMLVHNAPTCAVMQNTLKTADLPRTHTGLAYVTSLEYDPRTDVGNPWAALPSYWTQLLGSVDALNKNQPLPSC